MLTGAELSALAFVCDVATFQQVCRTSGSDVGGSHLCWHDFTKFVPVHVRGRLDVRVTTHGFVGAVGYSRGPIFLTHPIFVHVDVHTVRAQAYDKFVFGHGMLDRTTFVHVDFHKCTCVDVQQIWFYWFGNHLICVGPELPARFHRVHSMSAEFVLVDVHKVVVEVR